MIDNALCLSLNRPGQEGVITVNERLGRGVMTRPPVRLSNRCAPASHGSWPRSRFRSFSSGCGDPWSCPAAVSGSCRPSRNRASRASKSFGLTQNPILLSRSNSSSRRTSSRSAAASRTPMVPVIVSPRSLFRAQSRKSVGSLYDEFLRGYGAEISLFVLEFLSNSTYKPTYPPSFRTRVAMGFFRG